MADEIIDLTRYIKRESDQDLPRGAMALWGADGERSRFALPLWRVIYLASAERGVIVSRSVSVDEPPDPFVALDLAQEPARIEITIDFPYFTENDQPALYDHVSGGLLVFLGSAAGRAWTLVLDGGHRSEPLDPRTREDILFLAGECAGLLFLRDFGVDPTE